MADLNAERCAMPVRSAEERIKDFNEVALGYTDELAIKEASRCLDCKNPKCVKGCPVGIAIPDFIRALRNGSVETAYGVIAQSSLLPAICGRVCPQETQCEALCIRGIKSEPVAIGRLERYVADRHRTSGNRVAPKVQKNGHRAAVIGSGPAGLSCAGTLAAKGWDVTVFEALHKAGGVLVYGIPEFRLPKAIVAEEVEGLKALGVKIETNVIIGKTLTVKELMEEQGFEAVFIGSGAGLPTFLGIPGENLNGVYSANEFLTRINLLQSFKQGSSTPSPKGTRFAVIGGGNVAMDAARCARRLGGEVTVVYRRTRNELPARAEEIAHAEEEGITFSMLTAPLEVLSDDKGCVSGLRCGRMQLGEPDASGRRRPIPIENSDFTLEADCVIVAVGTSPNPLIGRTTAGLVLTKRGGIAVEEGTCKTSLEGVYAGGDAVTGAATVILAMGAGKQAAEEIEKALNQM